MFLKQIVKFLEHIRKRFSVNIYEFENIFTCCYDHEIIVYH